MGDAAAQRFAAWKMDLSRQSETVDTPCAPLPTLLSRAGFPCGVDFFSLDVEGAEEIVMRTVDPRIFKVLMVEKGVDKEVDQRIIRLMEGAGFSRSPNVTVAGSHVFLRRDVLSTLRSGWSCSHRQHHDLQRRRLAAGGGSPISAKPAFRA